MQCATNLLVQSGFAFMYWLQRRYLLSSEDLYRLHCRSRALLIQLVFRCSNIASILNRSTQFADSFLASPSSPQPSCSQLQIQCLTNFLTFSPSSVDHCLRHFPGYRPHAGPCRTLLGPNVVRKFVNHKAN